MTNPEDLCIDSIYSIKWHQRLLMIAMTPRSQSIQSIRKRGDASNQAFLQGEVRPEAP